MLSRFVDANCYLISHQDQAIIVDPAGIGEEILEVLKEEQLKLIAVINNFRGMWIT